MEALITQESRFCNDYQFMIFFNDKITLCSLLFITYFIEVLLEDVAARGVAG